MHNRFQITLEAREAVSHPAHRQFLARSVSGEARRARHHLWDGPCVKRKPASIALKISVLISMMEPRWPGRRPTWTHKSLQSGRRADGPHHGAAPATGWLLLLFAAAPRSM
jgi:hypothetical protein